MLPIHAPHPLALAGCTGCCACGGAAVHPGQVAGTACVPPATPLAQLAPNITRSGLLLLLLSRQRCCLSPRPGSWRCLPPNNRQHHALLNSLFGPCRAAPHPGQVAGAVAAKKIDSTTVQVWTVVLDPCQEPGVRLSLTKTMVPAMCHSTHSFSPAAPAVVLSRTQAR